MRNGLVIGSCKAIMDWIQRLSRQRIFKRQFCPILVLMFPHFIRILLTACIVLGSYFSGFAQSDIEPGKVVKASWTSADGTRSYYIFVPKNIPQDKKLPLLVTFHGSGRRGNTLVEIWKKRAERESIIVIGPDSVDPAGWRIPEDGPNAVHDLVEELKGRLPIDPGRIYLFGHSAGGTFTLITGLYQSEYFAAGALSAGALPQEAWELVQLATREIPFVIFVGDRDPYFPLDQVRATEKVLREKGLPVEVHEISGHDHNYYSIADRINSQAWTFLSRHRLPAEPKFREYKFHPAP